MQAKRLISVIIPVYNHFEELTFALQSLAEQEYRPLEIIVVDDGSENGIEKYIQQGELWGITMESQHNSIPLTLLKQKNSGAAAARNQGFQKAKGEYIIFWDADIVGKPNMLVDMAQLLDEHLDMSFVYSNFYFGNKKMPAQAFDKDILKERNYIAIATLLRKKDFPGFDESLKRFQDWDLWLTLCESGKKGIWIDAYLYRAFVRKKGISSWLPRFSYRKPFCYLPGIRKRVQEYTYFKQKILSKHGLDGA